MRTLLPSRNSSVLRTQQLKGCYVASVVSDSVRSHRWQPTRLPVPGILQARTLEWVAISFSNAWKWKVKGKLLSRVRLFVTPWTAAYQAPPSMGFSRQDTGVGCHCLLRTKGLTSVISGTCGTLLCTNPMRHICWLVNSQAILFFLKIIWLEFNCLTMLYRKCHAEWKKKKTNIVYYCIHMDSIKMV